MCERVLPIYISDVLRTKQVTLMKAMHLNDPKDRQ